MASKIEAIAANPAVWAKTAVVATERFDHTSVLQFLEKVTGVQEPNISDWRRRTFGDLTSAFRFGTSDASPRLPQTHDQLQQAQWQATTLPRPDLSAHRTPPAQEPGTRRRIPPAPGRD
ncbi:MAG TPA: hypothetical protein VH008_02695 [Pseudonocardia sp.]|nr:hypothetical protein [Pseudonocardia sp.]